LARSLDPQGAALQHRKELRFELPRALVLIGVAAAICAGSVPHMTTTKPFVTSRPAEAQQLVACSPQWLPVLLSSARQVPTGLNSGSCVEKSLASMRRANVHAAKSIEL
jgi:hypothetical protein